MNLRLLVLSLVITIVLASSCIEQSSDMNIVFLHHSTGSTIWKGTAKGKEGDLTLLFKRYNKDQNMKYLIKEMTFPKAEPYGWNNYPFDYYNIWVKNSGPDLFMKEPTLEGLTKEFQVIIFKHCFPVSNIQEEGGIPDIDSDIKSLSNYKLQYDALREKLHQFQNTKFILFTGAVQVESNITVNEALRAREFTRWVIDEWDIPGDNIYLWDFYSLETEGGLYFKDEFAVSKTDSHPNKEFAGRVVQLLFNRIVDISDNNGQTTSLIGEK